MKTKILFIGVDGETTVNSAETKKQIQEVESLDCVLEDEQEGRIATWKDFDNPDEPRTLFQSILRDRKRRVDEHTIMADRPSFAVITVLDNKAVRLEYYEGHDSLSLVYDLRSKELQGKKLPNFMDADPQAYDPAKFLKNTFGIPEEFSKSILDEAHKK